MCSQWILALHGSVEVLVDDVAFCSRLLLLNKGFGYMHYDCRCGTLMLFVGVFDVSLFAANVNDFVGQHYCNYDQCTC